MCVKQVLMCLRVALDVWSRWSMRQMGWSQDNLRVGIWGGAFGAEGTAHLQQLVPCLAAWEGRAAEQGAAKLCQACRHCRD